MELVAEGGDEEGLKLRERERNGQSFLVGQVGGVCDLNRGRIEVGWRLGRLALDVLRSEMKEEGSAGRESAREQARRMETDLR